MKRHTLTAPEPILKPIQNRLLIPLFITLFLLIVTFCTVLISQQKNKLNESNVKVANMVLDRFPYLLDRQAQTLAALEIVLLKNSGLRKALQNRDSKYLLETYGSIWAQLKDSQNITHFYFHDADRVNIIRIHNLEKY